MQGPDWATKDATFSNEEYERIHVLGKEEPSGGEVSSTFRTLMRMKLALDREVCACGVPALQI